MTKKKTEERTTLGHENSSPSRTRSATSSGQTSAPTVDLSRDKNDENSVKSSDGNLQVESSRPRAGLKTSCSELSLADARKRVLARLAESQSPEPESDMIGFRTLPRKLDPIFAEMFMCDDDDDNDDEDDQPPFFTCG